MEITGRIPGEDRLVTLVVEGETITGIEPFEKNTSHDSGEKNHYLCPGFFDPQVNGFAGVDFNAEGLTPEKLERASRGLALSGVTRFFPTLITAFQEKLRRQLRILLEALEKNLLFRAMAPGIHLEGPFISPEDGPRGAHPREAVRPPDWDEFKRLQETCRGKIRCITLAPEMEGAIPFIEKAVASGVVVGLGHTSASEAVLEDAFQAGARLSTHLGNGTPATLPRHQNPIQKQLSMDGLMASIIVDGIHLPDYVVKNFVRAKGPGRILLTTDSMAGAGAGPGRFTLGDLEVEVGQDRAARLSGTPYLAGSTLTMEEAVSSVIRFAGVDLVDALRMARGNGGRLFPEISGGIVSGGPADVVLFEYLDGVRVRATWIRGKKIETSLQETGSRRRKAVTR